MHLVLAPVRGNTHEQRLNSFYKAQAGNYDSFRERLLHGRRPLVAQLPLAPGLTWLDMGGGTGQNIELAGTRASSLEHIEVVDLCKPLLHVAEKRFERLALDNAHAVHGDATQYRPTFSPVDIVTFSYSLTMIPDWFAAIDHAIDLLKPGGILGVTDFYISRKYPTLGLARHATVTRAFWPLWFSVDNVHLNPDHLPFLQARLDTLHLEENLGTVPFLPGARVPYYVFLGRKR